MNKYSRKILKYLNKNFPQKYSDDELINNFKIDTNISNEVFDELLSQNFIEETLYYETCDNYRTSKSCYNSNLKGLEYFKNNRINNLKLIFNSIICPIIVSAITTLITIWLSGIFEAK